MNSAQLRACAAECFGKASIEVNGKSFMRSTTQLKRSAASALRGLLEKTSLVLPLLGVTSYAWKQRVALIFFSKPKRVLNWSEVPLYLCLQPDKSGVLNEQNRYVFRNRNWHNAIDR